DRTIGEIKRMWVADDARGLGVGRRILETLETRARDFGVSTLRLETNRTLKEAQALYRRSGYLEVEPFNDEPYARHWFEKVRIGRCGCANPSGWPPHQRSTGTQALSCSRDECMPRCSAAVEALR